MAKNKIESGGIVVLGLLGVSFIVLKLCKVIDWSWWYVTMPFWGGAAVALLIVLFVVIIELVIMYLDFKLERIKKNNQLNSKYPDGLYCFECQIEMPVKEHNGYTVCTNCGLIHK